MNTRDGYEIKIGDNVCNFAGETLVVKEFFPDSEETGKVVVTPQYFIESMHANCDGGSHREISVEVDYDAEDAVVDCANIFQSAPTAKIDEGIKSKRDELAGICQRIGLAKVELRLARDQSSESIKRLNDDTKFAEATLSEVRTKLRLALNSAD